MSDTAATSGPGTELADPDEHDGNVTDGHDDAAAVAAGSDDEEDVVGSDSPVPDGASSATQPLPVAGRTNDGGAGGDEGGEAADASSSLRPRTTDQLGSGEVEIDCPGCGLALVGDSPRPTASWFCPKCDYPLFWVPPPVAPPASTERRARRRLPGTGGTVVVGSEACWHCGEMNEPGTGECRRCAAVQPKPAAPTVVVEKEVPVPQPVLVRVQIWPYIAGAACAGAAIAMTVALWIVGGGTT